jgi:hypothetical protein
VQASLLHATRADPRAVAIEEKNFHPVSSLVGEKEEMAALRIQLLLTG